MKLVACSDNHNNIDVINRILKEQPDADFYFHMGDSEMDALDIKPFASVKGNVDYDYELPFERIIDIGNGHKAYLCHGNGFSGDPILVSKAAKANDCDLAFFGHTHAFYNQVINGVIVINPGSCSRPKDGCSSYCVVTIDDSVKVNKIVLD